MRRVCVRAEGWPTDSGGDGGDDDDDNNDTKTTTTTASSLKTCYYSPRFRKHGDRKIRSSPLSKITSGMVKRCEWAERGEEARSSWTSQRHFLLPYRLIKRFTRAPRADRRPSPSPLSRLASRFLPLPSPGPPPSLAPSLFILLLFFTRCNSNDCEERTTATTTMTTGTAAHSTGVYIIQEERCGGEEGGRERASDRERRRGGRRPFLSRGGERVKT